jgi:hypothetical protein
MRALRLTLVLVAAPFALAFLIIAYFVSALQRAEHRQ